MHRRVWGTFLGLMVEIVEMVESVHKEYNVRNFQPVSHKLPTRYLR